MLFLRSATRSSFGAVGDECAFNNAERLFALSGINCVPELVGFTGVVSLLSKLIIDGF